ncbi:MAG TPA: DUF1330 domain-containing protein [Acidimicrobiia bacterium]|nr:DUF1330 domain-containing protein [Acidimicrobiia bacterium]
MSAYVIVEVDVTNPEVYEEYRPLAGESVARHGGRFIVRGGKNEAWEGEWSDRIVVLEFEDLDAARAWYHSDDYQAAVRIRHRSSTARMIAVEGT